MIKTLRKYYQLTKPGIIYGNVFTTIAGFLLASKAHVNFLLLCQTIAGVACIIASACVFNNYIDRNIDKKMHRTQNRAFAKGAISVRAGLMYGALLGIIGFFLLTKYTNVLTVVIGIIGFIDYLVFYGLGKRKTVHGTVIGSISGSMPIVAGYTAVTNRFDLGALLLFFILTFWQMPHFYAIAIYRIKDYSAANLPVLPIKRGVSQTKIQMLLYVIAFMIATLLLSVFKFTGLVYTVIVGGLGLVWIWFSLQGFKTASTEKWARKMFFLSLIELMSFSILLFGTVVLP